LNWLVYMILSSDGSLYTGITNDIARRYSQHGGKNGAKFFRGRQPQKLVYVETGHDRSSASKREIAIKKLPRQEKLQLLSSGHNKVSDFPL
jgi:putative endonuclease